MEGRSGLLSSLLQVPVSCAQTDIDRQTAKLQTDPAKPQALADRCSQAKGLSTTLKQQPLTLDTWTDRPRIDPGTHTVHIAMGNRYTGA